MTVLRKTHSIQIHAPWLSGSLARPHFGRLWQYAFRALGSSFLNPKILGPPAPKTPPRAPLASFSFGQNLPKSSGLYQSSH
jgi:hypothetical protein